MARAQPKGLTEIDALDDDQVRALILGNLAKLNDVLMTRPSATGIRRLLRLEYFGRPEPRRDVLVRLRRALNRADGRERTVALEEVMANRAGGVIKSSATLLQRALE